MIFYGINLHGDGDAGGRVSTIPGVCGEPPAIGEGATAHTSAGPATTTFRSSTITCRFHRATACSILTIEGVQLNRSSVK